MSPQNLHLQSFSALQLFFFVFFLEKIGDMQIGLICVGQLIWFLIPIRFGQVQRSQCLIICTTSYV